jgi:hypothetical protein
MCSDGFVAWKTKKIPTHEHKLAKKTLRDGSNGELTLEERKRGLREGFRSIVNQNFPTDANKKAKI